MNTKIACYVQKNGEVNGDHVSGTKSDPEPRQVSKADQKSDPTGMHDVPAYDKDFRNWGIND